MVGSNDTDKRDCCPPKKEGEEVILLELSE